MRETKTNKNGSPLPLRLGLALFVLLACGTLLLSGNGRSLVTARETSTPVREEQAAVSAEPATQASPAELPSATEEPQEPEEKGTAAETFTPIVYDQYSYGLVADMINAYQEQKPDREEIIARDAAALKEYDPRLGEAWERIMDYWDYANARMELNYTKLPEDLPRDGSLCIVVMGFQLQMDGGMAPEMQGRCELALRAAEQYPEAFLVLAGGGTAPLHPEITEAGVMADWFINNGIPAERLILEDRSTTTEENAVLTREILTTQYPQVKNLVIVTSDYHMPLSCLMFTEAALLFSCEHGEEPFSVVSNLALQGYGLYEYKNPEEQAKYVRCLAELRASNP